MLLMLLFCYFQGEETREPGPGGQGPQSPQTGRPVLPGGPALPRGLPHLSRPAYAEQQEAGLPPPPVHGPPGQGEAPGAAGRCQQQRLHLHLLPQDGLVQVQSYQVGSWNRKWQNEFFHIFIIITTLSEVKVHFYIGICLIVSLANKSSK